MQGKWLFVSNLAWKVTESDLKDLFSQCCEVLETRVERKTTEEKVKQSRGFGYVRLKNLDECEKAIASLSGSVLKDRAITIQKALKPPKKKMERKRRKKKGMDGPRKRQKIDIESFCERAKADLNRYFDALQNKTNGKKIRKFWKDVVAISSHPEKETVKSFVKDVVPLLSKCALRIAQNMKEKEDILSTGYSKESPFALVKRSIERLQDLQETDQYREHIHNLVKYGVEWELQMTGSNSESVNDALLKEWDEHWPDAKEYEKRMKIVNEIKKCVKTAFPSKKEIDIRLFGSSATPLSDQTSDLDIGIVIPGVDRATLLNAEFALTILKPVQKKLFEAGLACKLITKTRIPLVRLKDCEVSTEICLYDSHNGKKATYITDICKGNRVAGPFLYAVKRWAHRRGLSNPRHPFGQGGLCSFGFTQIGITCLNMNKICSSIASKILKVTPEAETTPQMLLLNFFDLISKFSSKESMFTPRSGNIQARDDEKWDTAVKVIIEDPVDDTDNCARNVNTAMWRRIQRESIRAKILIEKGVSWKHVVSEGTEESERIIRLMFYC